MNNKDFGLEWGGKDWEFVDRVLGRGYEINKLSILRLVHFYHSWKINWYNNYGNESIEHQDKLSKNLINFENLFDYLNTFGNSKLFSSFYLGRPCI